MADPVINELADDEPLIRDLPDDELLQGEKPKGRSPRRVPLVGQFLSGIGDVTGALARPLEATLPTVAITSNGIEVLSPEEVSKRRAEGTFGLSSIEGKPKNIFGAAARLAGQTAAAAPIVGRLAGFVPAVQVAATTRLGKIAQFPQKFAHQAGQRFAAAPGATTLVDTGFGASAGAGGFIAEQVVPDSPAAKFVGELIGGVAPVFAPTSLMIRAAYRARGFVDTILHPFTSIGGQQRAAARAARAADPEQRAAAINELNQPTTLDPQTGQPVLTPAQRTGEPGLLSLERAVVESSEELLRVSDFQIAQANLVIQKTLREIGGEPASVVTPIQEAHNYLRTLLETRVRIAAQKTEERIAELGPKVSREQANRIARDEIGNALKAARAQEHELYSVIPETTPVPFQATKAIFDSFVRQLGKARQADMPDEAMMLLSEKSSDYFGKNIPKGLEAGETTLLELRALQSKMREVARNARAGEKRNLNQARIADELADAINDDIAKARGGKSISEAISAAVNFSRELNDRFSRGAVGTILGRRVSGGERVREGLTLEESIGVAGPRAREAMDDIVKAFDSPEAPSSANVINAAEEYFRGRFLQAAVDRGELNINSARRFLKQHLEVINRLPGLRRQIEEAIESGETLALTERQRARVRLDDPKASKATMMMDRGPVETFRQISLLKPSDAATEAQKLVNLVSRDNTGEALSGLKAGFIEFMFASARESARDTQGIRFLSGFALRETLTNPATNAAARKVFSPDELKRLDTIVKDLERLERRRQATLPKEGVIGDRPSKLVETVAGIAGAAAGRAHARHLGIGGTVQIPGIMANRFRDLMDAGVKDPAGRLLRDSVQDEKLFRELLQAPLDQTTKQLPKEAERRLNAWVAVVLAEYGGAFNAEESVAE